MSSQISLVKSGEAFHPIKVPPELSVFSAEGRKIYAIWMCQKVNRKGGVQSNRCLVVTPSVSIVADVKGKIKRVVKNKDITEIFVQPGRSRVTIKNSDLNEPTLVLQLLNDRRNCAANNASDMMAPLRCLNFVRRAFTGRDIPCSVLSDDTDVHSSPDRFGPFVPGPGYLSPLKKLSMWRNEPPDVPIPRPSSVPQAPPRVSEPEAIKETVPEVVQNNTVEEEVVEVEDEYPDVPDDEPAEVDFMETYQTPSPVIPPEPAMLIPEDLAHKLAEPRPTVRRKKKPKILPGAPPDQSALPSVHLHLFMHKDQREPPPGAPLEVDDNLPDAPAVAFPTDLPPPNSLEPNPPGVPNHRRPVESHRESAGPPAPRGSPSHRPVNTATSAPTTSPYSFPVESERVEGDNTVGRSWVTMDPYLRPSVTDHPKAPTPTPSLRPASRPPAPESAASSDAVTQTAPGREHTPTRDHMAQFPSVPPRRASPAAPPPPPPPRESPRGQRRVDGPPRVVPHRGDDGFEKFPNSPGKRDGRVAAPPIRVDTGTMPIETPPRHTAHPPPPAGSAAATSHINHGPAPPKKLTGNRSTIDNAFEDGFLNGYQAALNQSPALFRAATPPIPLSPHPQVVWPPDPWGGTPKATQSRATSPRHPRQDSIPPEPALSPRGITPVRPTPSPLPMGRGHPEPLPPPQDQAPLLPPSPVPQQPGLAVPAARTWTQSHDDLALREAQLHEKEAMLARREAALRNGRVAAWDDKASLDSGDGNSPKRRNRHHHHHHHHRRRRRHHHHHHTTPEDPPLPPPDSDSKVAEWVKNQPTPSGYVSPRRSPRRRKRRAWPSSTPRGQYWTSFVNAWDDQTNAIGEGRTRRE